MEGPELWRELGQQLRVDSIRAAAVTKSGHPTSSMSAADLMAVLLAKYLRYDFDEPDNPANDHLIFSKGHASPLLYSMYKAAGAISDEELLTFRVFGSRLQGHPTPAIPWVDVATGSLGQGLPFSVGIGLAGQAARPAAVPDLVPLRRQRDGRGLDVGGVRARGLLRARQPDRDHRREQVRPARRDDARLGSRLLRQSREGLRLARDRDRRPRRRGDRRGVRRGGRAAGPAHRDRGAHAQGQGRQGGRGQAGLARQGARPSRGGDRGARRRAQHRRRGGEAGGRASAHRFEVERRRAADVGARRGGRDAAGLRRRAGGARLDPRRRGRARRRGLELDLRRDLPRRASRTGTSRCTSPSSRWSPRRSASRCGSGCPSPRPSRPSSAAPTTSSAWPRSARRTSASAARTPASRSARTGRRRWRSRTSP